MNQVTHETHAPVLPALLAGHAVESARGPQWSALGRRHWGRVTELTVGRIVIDVEWQQAFRAYAASAELVFTTPRWQGMRGECYYRPRIETLAAARALADSWALHILATWGRARA